SEIGFRRAFSLVGKEGLEPPTFTMSKSSWGRPPLSFNVQKWLHDGLFGTWMILPLSADVRHFPCHRQYIGSTNRDYTPAPERRRGSGAARGYWGLLGATMKGQVGSFPRLGRRAGVRNRTRRRRQVRNFPHLP